MLRLIKTTTILNKRTFKNFGHKRQPIPGVTVLWHGFLTFTFIGLGVEWKRVSKFLFGEDEEIGSPWDSMTFEKAEPSNS